MRAVFVDATPALAEIAERLHRQDFELFVHRDPEVETGALPRVLDGARIAIVDHTYVTLDAARACRDLAHIVFLGTGAASYMDPQALASIGIAVHTIRGYGDTAVAEHAIALAWAAAKGLARMDREIRAGHWPRAESAQLTGKTLGVIGFGGIGREAARLGTGIGMKVVAWNRTRRDAAGVEFVTLERLLAESHVVSMHLLLNDETRGFLTRERIAAMRPGAILINTARGALVDESAMVEALRSGHLAHAGLDVFDKEPLPAGHALTMLPNVTLSSHAAFATPEAAENLIEAALTHCRRITAQ